MEILSQRKVKVVHKCSIGIADSLEHLSLR